MFVTFEGIDGCGKSTQIERLDLALNERGITAIITREPGGTEIGETIRRILLSVENIHMAPLAELFLYEADRVQHVTEIIKPALEAGKVVVCDRYYDATTVYQGVVLGQNEELIEQLNRLAGLGCEPDITFLLDCPAEIGLERVTSRENRSRKKDRFERKKLDFHNKIRYGYLSLANKHKNRFQIIDSTLPEDRVAEKIWQIASMSLERCF